MTYVMIVFALVWVGATLLIDDCLHRPERKSLADRIEPYSRSGVAEEAGEWLSER